MGWYAIDQFHRETASPKLELVASVADGSLRDTGGVGVAEVRMAYTDVVRDEAGRVTKWSLRTTSDEVPLAIVNRGDGSAVWWQVHLDGSAAAAAGIGLAPLRFSSAGERAVLLETPHPLPPLRVRIRDRTQAVTRHLRFLTLPVPYRIVTDRTKPMRGELVLFVTVFPTDRPPSGDTGAGRRRG